MSKMREAFELWSTDDNPEHWNQRRGFEAGYQAAIADVKANAISFTPVDIDNLMNAGVHDLAKYLWANNRELYKLPEDTP